jgi:hypothetical protein
MCELLIDYGAQFDVRVGEIQTLPPLHRAAASANLDVCALLLERGHSIDLKYTPDPNDEFDQEFHGLTALHYTLRCNGADALLMQKCAQRGVQHPIILWMEVREQ